VKCTDSKLIRVVYELGAVLHNFLSIPVDAYRNRTG